jgi:transcriptional repressor NrdR
LQELDLVAYMRFASVYRAFDSLDDFEAAIAELRQVNQRPSADDDVPDAVRQETEDGSGGTTEVPVPATAAD